MDEFNLFILTFLFIFVIYEIFVVSKTKRKKAKGKLEHEPMEIQYLINRYKLDMKKVNYNQLLQIVSLVSSFDIALVASIVLIPDNFILRICLGFVSVIGSILLSYHLVYLFYKKKGMIK